MLTDLERRIGYRIDFDIFWVWYKDRLRLLHDYEKAGDKRARPEIRKLLFFGQRFNWRGEIGPKYKDLAISNGLSTSRVQQLVIDGIMSVEAAAEHHDDIHWVLEKLPNERI